MLLCPVIEMLHQIFADRLSHYVPGQIQNVILLLGTNVSRHCNF